MKKPQPITIITINEDEKAVLQKALTYYISICTSKEKKIIENIIDKSSK